MKCVFFFSFQIHYWHNFVGRSFFLKILKKQECCIHFSGTNKGVEIPIFRFTFFRQKLLLPFFQYFLLHFQTLWVHTGLQAFLLLDSRLTNLKLKKTIIQRILLALLFNKVICVFVVFLFSLIGGMKF